MDNQIICDWKGNVIKAGDEICHIRIRTGGWSSKGRSLMIPDGEGHWDKIEIPDDIEEDCWDVGEYYPVSKSELTDELVYTQKMGDFNCICPLHWMELSENSKQILAIKGVSDFKS